MSGVFRLGVFIFVALLILTGAVFLIGSKKYLFSSTYSLRCQFPTVIGLNDGSEVRVGGIHQGTVRNIELPQKPEDKVTVLMDVDTRTRKVLKKDSVASIKTEGLIGNKYVEITFGSDQAEGLKDGDTIGAAPPLDISDLVNKTNDILESAKNTMQNADAISAKINNGQGSVGKLINDKQIYEQVNAATAQAKAGATAFQENMEALKHNFFLRGFFKGRGYQDENELKKHEISRLPAEQPAKTFNYDAKQIFSKPDAAKLKNQKSLNEAGQYLQDNKFGMAVVAAYAGATGDTDKDRELSEAQSMVIRDYLAKTFKFDDTRVKTIGLGKAKDPADASKIEIMVYPAAANGAVAQKK